MKVNAGSFLGEDEIRELKQPSNKRAVWMFVCNWTIIAGAFSLVALLPNVFTVLFALLVIGGRQLGLGILLHECAHRSFFNSVWLNDFVGHWFAGLAILVPIDFYRPYHFSHHTKTGTEQDPDVGNIAQYPVSKTSFKRKILRDFAGLSGLKSMTAMLLYVLPGRAGNAVSLGINKENIAKDAGWRMGVRNYAHVALVQGTLFLILWLCAHPELYVLWWLAYLFTHPFIIRVRQIAEHGAMPQLASYDVRDTTRTTLAKPWERLFFAPNYVNYHCEHHLLPTVPSYNLPRMHRLLVERGFYQHKPAALVGKGYPEIIRLASSGA